MLPRIASYLNAEYLRLPTSSWLGVGSTQISRFGAAPVAPLAMQLRGYIGGIAGSGREVVTQGSQAERSDELSARAER